MKKLIVLLTMVLGMANISAQEVEDIQSVDLGLSIKWANMNVGATNPRDPGGYYACGETRLKTGYGIYNYFPNEGREYDVALKKWKYWRMPTREEIKELFEKCQFDVYKTPENEQYCKVTGPNGNHIILPLPGYISEEGGRQKWLTRYWGWNYSGFSYNAQSKKFSWGSLGIGDGGNKYHGCLVRAVTSNDIKNQKPIAEKIEDLPKYERGEYSLYCWWLPKHFYYPPYALRHGIKGNVVLSFTIDTDGSIKDIKVESSPHACLSEAAVQTISGMPKWIPGKVKGQITPIRYVLPIKYDISSYTQHGY